MSAAEQTSPIRDAHRGLTQSRIIDAAIDLMRNEDLDTLRMADVAVGAGVTVDGASIQPPGQIRQNHLRAARVETEQDAPNKPNYVRPRFPRKDHLGGI